MNTCSVTASRATSWIDGSHVRQRASRRAGPSGWEEYVVALSPTSEPGQGAIIKRRRTPRPSSAGPVGGRQFTRSGTPAEDPPRPARAAPAEGAPFPRCAPQSCEGPPAPRDSVCEVRAQRKDENHPAVMVSTWSGARRERLRNRRVPAHRHLENRPETGTDRADDDARPAPLRDLARFPGKIQSATRRAAVVAGFFSHTPATNLRTGLSLRFDFVAPSNPGVRRRKDYSADADTDRASPHLGSSPLTRGGTHRILVGGLD
jgi:hypothetical protein